MHQFSKYLLFICLGCILTIVSAGGGSENSFVQPLGYLLGLTAIISLILSYAKQSTIVAFIVVGASINAMVGNENFDATILGHFSEVGILVLLFMAGLEVELHAF